MRKHGRFLYQPVLPMGKDGRLVTGCKAHRTLAANAAAEGTVLLKNDGTLPLKPGAKICMFGSGVGEFLFGGGGSGRVNTTNRITLAQGLEAAAARGELSLFSELVDFYTKENDKIVAEAFSQMSTREFYIWNRHRVRRAPEVPEALYRRAVEFGDTAIFCLSRFSSEGDDCGDRSGNEGDFTLWPEEQVLLDRLTRDFEKVIVVLNVCGVVSTREYKNNDRIGAVLYAMYGGSMAGEVLTDILLGKRYPSGHLQDTMAETIDDYPTTRTFRESKYFVNYTEDIFIGYRYFETFRPEAVTYPFGYGLGYTTFSMTCKSATLEKFTVKLVVNVKNTGNGLGKEVAQVYMSAPQGKLGKAKKVLCAFGKTRELKPGEEVDLKLHFDIRAFGSFDDLGKICKSAFLLEKGGYTISLGNNVRDTKDCLTFHLNEDMIVRRCHSYMAPRALKERLTADGTLEALPQAQKAEHKPVRYKLKDKAPEQPIPLIKALAEDRLDAFMAGMSTEDIAEMLYGHPMMCNADTNGIGMMPRGKLNVAQVPNVPTADGPAGLRTFYDSDVTATHLPCANAISQSWNLKLAERLAVIGALEVKENNIGIWLTPALNIHRNPMCGRNYEYFSEDPLVSGLFAASTVKGIQSQNIAATVKHYLANNKEFNRKESDSRVSERALREIYLKGFEICIKKANPWCLMTAYNLVNGEQSSTNWEAINGILRGEWKYDGVVMTDWRAFSDLNDEVYAGSDVKMPELISVLGPNTNKEFDPVQAICSGKMDKEVCLASVRRILRMMGRLD